MILDGTWGSSLQWNIEPPETSVLWKLDLGLFDRLRFPLSHEGQFQALRLSLDHFVDTVFAHYREKTQGVCLWEGTFLFDGIDLDPLPGFPEVEGKILARSMAAFNYLHLLTAHLPDDLRVFVKLTGANEISAPLKALILGSDSLERVELIADGNARLERGVLVPPCERIEFERFSRFIDSIPEPYRPIAEGRLTLEWEGLDELWVDESMLSGEGRRAVAGFVAAGGVLCESVALGS